MLAERHRELLRRRDTDMQQQLERPPAPERDPPLPPAHHTSMHRNTLAAEREGEVRWGQSGGVGGGSRSGEGRGGGGQSAGWGAGWGSRVGAWWDGGIGGDIGGTPMVRNVGKRRRGVRAGDEDDDIAGETHGCVMRERHAEVAVVAREGQARQLKAPQLPDLPASAHTLPGKCSLVLPPLASIPQPGRELARISGERDREEGAGEGRADGMEPGILVPKVRYLSTSKLYGGYCAVYLMQGVSLSIYPHRHSANGQIN